MTGLYVCLGLLLVAAIAYPIVAERRLTKKEEASVDGLEERLEYLDEARKLRAMLRGYQSIRKVK